MAGPNEGATGRGKGKGTGRVGGGSASGAGPGSGAREPLPGEITPPSTRPGVGQRGTPEERGSNGGVGRGVRVLGDVARRCCEPVEAPRVKPVCMFFVCVAVLAVCRGLFLPHATSTPPPATMSAEEEDTLIRLVLDNELSEVKARLKNENRKFEDLLEAQANAADEIKVFEESLAASRMELEELEEVGQSLHDENTGDASLTTQVSRAQENLRNLHRSILDALQGSKQRLAEQAKTMEMVREKVAHAREQAGENAAAIADESLETRLEGGIRDLEESYADLKGALEERRDMVLSASEVKALLDDAVRSARSHSDGEVGNRTDEMIRSLAREAVNRAFGSNGIGFRRTERGECFGEEEMYRVVDKAILTMSADGTGLADYANVVLGGRVLTSAPKGAPQLTSETFMPSGGLSFARYWQILGVESGIGPVSSVISEDSSLGACWAMAGASGRVTIQLPHEITVESVTVEHVSRLVSLDSSSAPREFQVFGLRSTGDQTPVRFGKGVYQLTGGPIQTFPIEPLGRKFKLIQFRIQSNWGNPDFTCIYRLRVHGSS